MIRAAQIAYLWLCVQAQRLIASSADQHVNLYCDHPGTRRMRDEWQRQAEDARSKKALLEIRIHNLRQPAAQLEA